MPGCCETIDTTRTEKKMSKKERGKKKIALDSGAEGFGHNPFAALQGKVVAEEKASEEKTENVEKHSEPQKASKEAGGFPARVVLRSEWKGRGGKEVTFIEGLEGMDAEDRAQWARKLRKALGVGATVEGSAIMVQGDQKERLDGLLKKNGAKHVVWGN